MIGIIVCIWQGNADVVEHMIKMSGASELPIHQRLTGTCICGHGASQHGSNGFICCRTGCDCKKFVEAHDSKKPVASKDIKA
jgi:hypothetical protein